MIYYGGPVIANPKVWAVWWGGPANLPSALTATTGGIGDFYAGVLDSPFADSLAQYATNLNAQAGAHSGAAGTGQTIGRGNYAGAVSLPSAPIGTVTDADVQHVLEAALNDGTLPPADANTIYAIYFPSSVSITSGGTSSCQGFGGYHDQSATNKVAFLVIPDCGFSFNGYCSVSSHELAEATTDLIPTPGSNPDFPQAWNDSGGNEVGDLCQGSKGTIATAKGTFTVQSTWDEGSHSCRVTSHAARDYSVAMSPTQLTLSPGAQSQLQVNTLTSAGIAQALTLTVTAPAGVTATLGSSASSGDKPMLTLSAGANVSVKDGQVVVSAVSADGIRHSAAVLLQVSNGSDAGSSSDAGDAGAQSDAGTSSDAGAPADGGTTHLPDAGNPDGGTTATVTSGGCGSSTSTALALPFLLLLFVFFARRAALRKSN